MASNTPKLGGYDLQFVSEPPDALVCLICTLVARDPQQMDCCGRVYCQLCLSEHKKHSDLCPQCRKTGNIFEDKRGAREIKALKVMCRNEKDGCEWVNDLLYLEDHLKLCDYALVSCDNKCKDGDNITKLLRKDSKEHLESKCPRRQYECSHCQQKGEYQEMVGSHLDTCPNVSTDCPNEGCHKRFPRISAAGHATVCDYQLVACKYAEVGCTERVLRKDLKEHEDDDQFHLRITIQNTLKLQQKMMEMEQRINQLDHQKYYTLKVKSFTTLKSEDKSFFSQDYYLKGYKIRMGVWTNGYGNAKGTHVSVYAFLEKGKYDDHLTWPFTGTITTELLNQLEDKNHFSRELVIYTKREKDDNILGTGGYLQFISHTELSYKSDKNCQYLRDDTLVFRVSINIPDHKPWLDCTILPKL